MPSQPQVKYRGPHARLVIDGKVLERDGAPVVLTKTQLERVRNRNVEVLAAGDEDES